MQFRPVLFGTALLLGSGAAAHAQTPVQSKVTMNLTLEQTQSVGDSGDTKIQKLRFNTKDFINVMRDITGDEDIESVVIERTVDPGDDDPDIDFLNQELVLLDNQGVEVDDDDAITQTALDLSDDLSSPLLAQTASAMDEKDEEIVSRTDIGLEGENWLINGANDDVAMSMLARITAKSKRKTDRGEDEGLFFRERTANIQGGMDVDISTDNDVDGTGVLSGTIKAGPEEIVPD
jgi:hypothetical protein